MNQKKILIGSTSFLVPSNQAWKSLEKNYTLSFGEYGDWGNNLLNSNQDEILVLTIFLDDLFGLKNKSYKNMQSILSSLIELVESHLKKTTHPLILCISYKDDDNLLNRMLSKTDLDKIKLWLFNKLEKISDIYSNLYLIDLFKEFARSGVEKCYDSRNWYFAHCHLSSFGLSIVANSINKVLNHLNSQPSKVLVLDCDNTLWNGVIGEDGIAGVNLGSDGIGQAFVDFQHEIKNIKRKGFILAIASKNNESDVWDMFKKHDSMILRKTDIVSWRINWIDKSINIKEMANELGLALNSFVFWDDNPVERDKMKIQNPDVKVIDAPKNILEWPSMLKNLDCFSKPKITHEDVKKSNQYKNRAKFQRDSSSAINEEKYLESINLTPQILSINDSNISRASQLCLKTNQFNLRTSRHSESDIMSMIDKDSELAFLVNLKDIYGDHGIISLVCLKKISSETVLIETFLMSCRVIGRGLESWILHETIKLCNKKGYKNILGQFIQSERNHMAKEFYSNHGFTELNTKKFKIKNLLNQDNLFIIDPNKFPLKKIKHFKL
jgi:FkbH-like protein